MNKQLFSGNVSIFYGQFYIDALEVDEDDYLDMESAFCSQNNGLCGASHNGKLFFVVGPQDGTAKVSVELHATAPELDPACQDVVECNLIAGHDDLHLCEWANEETHRLELPRGDYVVRYSISNLDRDYTDADDWDDPIAGQEYTIQLWPGRVANDRVIRSDTDIGRYWHKELGSA